MVERVRWTWSGIGSGYVGAAAPKVLKVIGYVLSITWKAHAPSFYGKNDCEVFSSLSAKFSEAGYVRCSHATFYNLVNVMDQGTWTLPV